MTATGHVSLGFSPRAIARSGVVRFETVLVTTAGPTFRGKSTRAVVRERGGFGKGATSCEAIGLGAGTTSGGRFARACDGLAKAGEESSRQKTAAARAAPLAEQEERMNVTEVWGGICRGLEKQCSAS